MPTKRKWSFKPKTTPSTKRTASNSVTSALPEPDCVERSPLDVPEFLYPPAYYSTAQYSTTTRASAEARASDPSSSVDWMQVTADLFMWTNVPRSALSFGVGCSCILWTSLVEDTKYSAINMSAHMGLLYLAAAFFKAAFLNRATSASSSSVPTLTEADALKLIRVFLPTINVLLSKSAELFSGEPTVTLKVAVVLWLLVQAGYRMNLWTLARFAYFALFIAPKCYLSYREQIHQQAEKCLRSFWTIWCSCGHKKAVILAAFALTWNLSSLSTRMFGGFICLVTLHARQNLLQDVPETVYS